MNDSQSAGKLATTMFVRFRQGVRKLALSLVETRRVNGKIEHEHIASLGSIRTPPAVHERIAFWQRLHERLAKLGNRIDPATQGRLLGDIHSRVPMVTPDEQRAAQLENAKDDASFFARIRDMHQGTVDEHKSLATTVADAIHHGKASAADAERAAQAAQERAERIERGEDVAGGLGKPRARDDFDKAMLAAGFTKRDLRRMKMIAEACDLGPEVTKVFMQAATDTESCNRHVERQARATLELFGALDPTDRAAAATAMLEANKSRKRR